MAIDSDPILQLSSNIQHSFSIGVYPILIKKTFRSLYYLRNRVFQDTCLVVTVRKVESGEGPHP